MNYNIFLLFYNFIIFIIIIIIYNFIFSLKIFLIIYFNNYFDFIYYFIK